MMNKNALTKMGKQYRVYLIFMLLACGGAFVWQLCLPDLAGDLSLWESSVGWQREIALWNVGLITAIVFGFIKQDEVILKVLTLQSAVLCWVLGANHLISLLQDFSFAYGIHILGVVEVLLIGGIWGGVLLWRSEW
jgi:hypothetical protein